LSVLIVIFSDQKVRVILQWRGHSARKSR